MRTSCDFSLVHQSGPGMPSSAPPASFDIGSASGSYSISIDEGLLDTVLRGTQERVYIVDDFFAARLTDAGLDPIALAAEEETKSLDRMTEVIEAMKQRRTTRSTTIIAIGGGVVQDAACFAASVYMRGVPWIYVPTTLLSMTDSCIGGKSSINVGRLKNIVGTFHPPAQVVIDPLLAATLSAEQRIAGLCESVKICMCRGPETLERYLALNPSADADGATLTAVIELCLRAKKWFIEIDEFDRKERLVLNFGHTFGHAIEAASGFAVSHGVAVGLGMIAAGRLASRLDPRCDGYVDVAAFHDHVRRLLAGVDGLADSLRGIAIAELMECFDADKKHSREAYAVIVVTETGAVQRQLLKRDGASAAMIAESFAAVLAEFG